MKRSYRCLTIPLRLCYLFGKELQCTCKCTSYVDWFRRPTRMTFTRHYPRNQHPRTTLLEKNCWQQYTFYLAYSEQDNYRYLAIYSGTWLFIEKLHRLQVDSAYLHSWWPTKAVIWNMQQFFYFLFLCLAAAGGWGREWWQYVIQGGIHFQTRGRVCIMMRIHK